ncbi:MAG TPA: cyanophycinase [Bryobacteraceae bacterium]|nr:cyanophycinase [Bryobacteraceae bacterium]
MQPRYCACLIALLAVAAHAENGWEYSRLANPEDVVTVTTGGTLFAGGGTDVDDAFRWMCAKANGGDFLIIRASGTAAYNTYVSDLCPALNSVATLIITSRNGAQQPFVADTIRKAEAIFIAGGDQANYINFYAGTPVADAINERAARGVPVGGTSAGNAVLAQFGYSALTGSVTSKQALADPFTPLITISNGFLNLSPLLRGFFTDDHFAARDRMGRLVAFLARVIQEGSAPSVSAIATDERTAYLMEPDGSGRVVGSGAAYFIRTTELPEVCKPGKPLTFKNLYIYRVRAGGTFNISKWTGTPRAAYGISAINGVLTPVEAGGSIY